MDEGTETEAAFHELLKRFKRANFERLGLEPKAGETEEDEKVRQLVISNMIKANDEAAKAQASTIFEAHADDLKNFQLPSVCKSWSTKSSTMKTKNLANNTWILMLRHRWEL